MESYFGRYIPGIITQLTNITLIGDQKSDLYRCYVQLATELSALNAIVGLSQVYENDEQLQLSIAINSFMQFIADAHEDKMNYIYENAQGLIEIFEVLQKYKEIDNDKVTTACNQLMDIIKSYRMVQ